MNDIKKSTKRQLSDEQLSKIKKAVFESMSNDRHSLLVDFPFTASIAMRLDLKPIRDLRCRTACVDGKTLYFDCDFYSKLTPAERKFIMAHEVWHCIMMHFARLQTRNRELFNIATDMEVNHLLKSHTEKSMSLEAPEGVLFPPTKLEGKSAEEIYDYLVKQAKKQKKDGNGGDSQDASSSNGQSSSSKSGKSGKSKLSGQFDKHTYSNDPEDEKNKTDSVTSDQWGEVSFDKDFNPAVSEDAAEKMREAIASATQQYERTQGPLPSNLRGIIDKIVKPEIRWQDLLTEFVVQCYGDNRNWLPPNRRHVYNDMYFQSRKTDEIDGIVAIDTSGSCVEDLPKFFSELKSLIDTFGRYKLKVIQADAAVDHVEDYDSYDNPLELDAASEIGWYGGGGTDYGPVFKYIEDEGIDPKFVIYIGDGYADMSYDKVPTYPVMWILTKDGNENFCSWGKKIKFKYD